MAEGNSITFMCYDMPKRSFKLFEEMKEKKDFCDVTIQVGSDSISAHRIILASVIPYFRHVLSPTNGNQTDESNVLPHIDPKALKCLIEFAYSCQVSINNENVRNLLLAACQLHVDDVRDACFDFLWNNLVPESVISIREYLNNFDCSDLLKKIDCYISDNFEEVSETKGFLECSFSYVKKLIAKDDLNVTKEENVFRSVMNWVKASPDVRKVHLPDLLTKIRMMFFKPLYLTDIVKNEELIRTSLACRDLIDEARNYISFPETRTSVCSFKTEPRKTIATTNVSEQEGRICIRKLGCETKYTVQHFNLPKGRWVTETSRAFYANDGCAVEMNNKIYFFRWGDAMQIDREQTEFNFLPDVPTPRIFAGVARLKNKIYVCGGRVDRTANSVVECFDPTLKKWSKVSSMLRSLWGISAVTVDDHIFILGGQDHRALCNSVQRYDPVMNKWENSPSMHFKRCYAGAAVLNGKIYICGGNTCVDDIKTFANSEMYNPITRCWNPIASMNTPRCWFTLLTYNGNLYVIGGERDGKQVHYMEIYETKNNKWTPGHSTDTTVLTSAAFVMPAGGS